MFGWVGLGCEFLCFLYIFFSFFTEFVNTSVCVLACFCSSVTMVHISGWATMPVFFTQIPTLLTLLNSKPCQSGLDGRKVLVLAPPLFFPADIAFLTGKSVGLLCGVTIPLVFLFYLLSDSTNLRPTYLLPI